MNNNNSSTKKSQKQQRKNTQSTNGQQQKKSRKSPNKGAGAAGVVTTFAPVSVGNKTRQRRAQIKMIGENMWVKHTEYVYDVIGNTGIFNVTSNPPIAMNPGQQPSFPWLSKIASRFESYNFKKLDYRFVTESSTANTGYVALCPDYDPADAAPSSKSQAMQYEGTAKGAPWENLRQVSSVQDLNKRKTYYVRQGSLEAGGNLNSTDSGNLYVIVGGNASSPSTLGELWCDYEVLLETPVMNDTSSPINSTTITGASSQTPAAPFGALPTQVVASGLNPGTMALTGGASVFTFVTSGQYQLSWLVTDSVAASTPVATYAGQGTKKNASTIGSGTVNMLNTFQVNAVAGDTIVFSYTGTGTTSSVLSIAPFAYSLSLL